MGRTVRFTADSVRIAAIESESVQLMRSTGFNLPPVQVLSFATTDISCVRIVNRARGARDGAIAGFLAGLALGGTTRVPIWENPADFSTAALVYVVIGVTVGSMVGSHVGSATSVKFTSSAIGATP